MLHRFLVAVTLLVVVPVAQAETRAVCKAACRDAPFVAECVTSHIGTTPGCRRFATKVCLHAGVSRCSSGVGPAAIAGMFGTWDFAYGTAPTFISSLRFDFAYYDSLRLAGRDLSLRSKKRTAQVVFQAPPTSTTYEFTAWQPGLIFCNRFDFDLTGEGQVVGVQSLVPTGCVGDPIVGVYELMVGLRR